MNIESVTIKGFRSFGQNETTIRLNEGVTAFVGTNGSGKTALLMALSRVFGVSPNLRRVVQRDFHLPPGRESLESGDNFSIDIVFTFPELERADQDEVGSAVPQFFRHMAAESEGGPLTARLIFKATWIDDGTPSGSIDEDLRWVHTLGEDYVWDQCEKVLSVQRGSIQLVYVPATRNVQDHVTALLKGRLWQAAKWSSEFQESAKLSAETIQEDFEKEVPTRFILDRLTARWRQVHTANTDSEPLLRLIDSQFEELVRKAEFAFTPDEAGQERPLADLSDGQRSLFHIALTATTLEVERDALDLARNENVFDYQKLPRAHLTLLAIEEPENSLSPFFLSRVIQQARDISELNSAQVLVSSHSASILSRIEPDEVRYFRLRPDSRSTSVHQLTLPPQEEEASKYVRLAIRAYPELYFASFVILAEGDSEQIVIPRIAEAMGVSLDPSFVPIVPLGGRYVSHFWRLLDDLSIPHATLLDLDMGRSHGGAKVFRSVHSELRAFGRDFSATRAAPNGDVNAKSIEALEDSDLLDGESDWLGVMQELGVFFSHPLDLDFAMLQSFSSAYQHPRPGGSGPRDSAEAALRAKRLTLKEGGNQELYGDEYKELFRWYPYLFLNQSKPEGQLVALARITDSDLASGAPASLKALVEHVRESIHLEIQKS